MLRTRLSILQRSLRRRLTREYNFGSTNYCAAFGDLPTPDDDAIRASALNFLANFDKQSWYDNPICTILRGTRFTHGGTERTTKDAFEGENGRQLISSTSQINAVIDHLLNYKAPKNDLRKEIRAIEDELLTEHVGLLVGNQALDFKKQDGVTECSEWTQACVVERRLADQLLADEEAGNIIIRRNPSFVGCVSNFSNFLDLSRKTLRHIELGVPAVVLSRSGTSQHMFRWAELTIELLEKHGVDQGMVTYLSAPLSEKMRVMGQLPESPFFLTGSRETAADIKKQQHRLMASTGGPNTMVAVDLTPKIKEAVKLSTCIENSGQCTAMRHLACSDEVSLQIAEGMFGSVPRGPDAHHALKNGNFAAVFDEQPQFSLDTAAGYVQHQDLPMGLRVNGKATPPADIDEKWREVYLDVTPGMDFSKTEDVQRLAKWLNTHQPISLAVNAKEAPYHLFARLFDATALVVYTVGSDEYPALTAQARPQDGEVFGEFPPRHELETYTQYPMVVPSPGPCYNSTYTKSFLEAQAKKNLPRSNLDSVASLISDPLYRGYAQVVLEYLVDATRKNPERGPTGSTGRTALFGLQRPPSGTVSVIRTDSLDGAIIRLLPFLATNAKTMISVSSSNPAVVKALEATKKVEARLETEDEYEAWLKKNEPWNVLEVKATDAEDFALAGQFVSLLFPLGHVKSTKPLDEEFVRVLNNSKKWLNIEG